MAGGDDPADEYEPPDEASRVFGAALFSGLPVGTVFVTAAAYDALRFGGAAADPRWRQFLAAPVLSAAVDWVGAAKLRGASGGADPPGAGPLPLKDAVPRLEKRARRVLTEELERFWADAEEAARGGSPSAGTRPGEGLHSMANLALLWALVVVVMVADHSMERGHGGRAMLKQIFAILDACGIPSQPLPGEGPADWGLDDLVFTGTWIGTYWSAFTQDCTNSILLNLPPLQNPPQDHPHVPANIPPVLIATLPAPTERPPNGPIPADLLRPEYCRLPARDYLGWLDPLLVPPVHWSARDRALATHVSDVAAVGHNHFMHMSLYAATRIEEFRRWLGERELSVLDVLLAKEVAEKAGSIARAVRQPGSGGDDVDAAYLERLARNPFLPEAIRRRDHLYEAVQCLRRALPAAVATAGETGHIAELAGALPNLDVPQRMAVLGLLILSRQMSMSLCSPELFEDLDGWGRSAARAAAQFASPGPAEAPENETDMLRTVWFSSRSFAEASRHAMVISRQARSLVSDLGPERLRLFYFTGIACRAAISASWLHLLVLKRFRHIAARAAPHAQARAVAVHGAMSADVRACLDLLQASDLPPFQEARVVLRSIVEGDEVRLARADVQILTLARAVAARCPHGGGGGAEGACWICAVRRQGGQ
ncbi:hypothetical protein DFJ74DRAFT_680892, partial [Hyaloraphidium curvatum]